MRFYRGTSPQDTAPRRRMRRFLLALPVLLTAYLFLTGENGLFRILDRTRQIEAARVQIASLRAENARLAEEAALLRDDLKTIERIARERFGMVRPNESVYMVYPTPPEGPQP